MLILRFVLNYLKIRNTILVNKQIVFINYSYHIERVLFAKRNHFSRIFANQ